MNPENTHALGVGGFEVEDVDFPQRFGLVEAGFGEVVDVVFHKLIWGFYVWNINVGNYDVLVQIHLCSNPFHLSFIVHNLKQIIVNNSLIVP